MWRLLLPACALGAILIWWRGDPSAVPRRALTVIDAVPMPLEAPVAGTPAPPPSASAAEPPALAHLPMPVFEGTVTDPEGRGVEGVAVTVTLLRRHSSGYRHYLGRRLARTDATGRFQVKNMGSAEWATLRFDAPGWVQPSWRTVSPDGTTLSDGTPADARALNLVHGEDWPRQRIVLERGLSIDGVAETAGGTPLPDVWVEAAWAGRRAEVRTDERGRFSILVPESAVLVARAHGDRALTPATIPDFDAPEPRFRQFLAGHAEGCVGPVAPGSKDVRIVLHEMVPLRMRVHGPEGPLDERVTVRLRDLARPRDALQRDLYVRDGETNCVAFMPGRYEIEVSSENAWLPVRLLATLPGEPVEVRFAEGLFIEGLLEADDVKWFEITWTGPGSPTACLQGPEFRLSGLADGAGDLYVRRDADPRYALVSGCRPGRGMLRITLSEGSTIGGHVAVPEGLDPSGLDVWAVRGSVRQHASVRKDGTFTILGLPPGVFRVELVSRGWRSRGQVVLWIHDTRDDVPVGTEDVVLRVRLPAGDPDGGD